MTTPAGAGTRADHVSGADSLLIAVGEDISVGHEATPKMAQALGAFLAEDRHSAGLLDSVADRLDTVITADVSKTRRS